MIWNQLLAGRLNELPWRYFTSLPCVLDRSLGTHVPYIHAPKRQSRDLYPETTLKKKRASSEPHLSSGADTRDKRLRRDCVVTRIPPIAFGNAPDELGGHREELSFEVV